MSAIMVNRRFVNIYEVIYNKVLPNQVKLVGSYEGRTYKDAKNAFDLIKKDPQFTDNRFSVQIQDFDARLNYGLPG